MTDSSAGPPKPQASAPGRAKARRSLTDARPVRLVVLALATAVVGVGSVLLYAHWTRPAAPVTPTTASLESSYKSEEDWLITRIVEDLSGMAGFAAAGRDDGAHARVATDAGSGVLVTLRITPSRGSAVSERLRFEHSVWSPEDYQALAARLLENWRTRPAEAVPSPDHPAADEEALLRRLLDLRAEVIQTENWAISKALTEEPANPRLHEDAALLLGAFALREAPGHFEDVRPTLCRMTAHLALARGLRASSPLGPSGRYAEAVLAALSERGAEAEAALTRLGAATGGSQVQEAWRRALLLRITDDWRILPHPETASLVERLEWLRAVQFALSGDSALQMLERGGSGPGPEVDWAMILSRAPCVQVGNAFLDAGLDTLLREADETWSRIHGAALAPGQRIAALNEPAQLFLAEEGPRVIAWGTWASQYQRHILQLLKQAERHERWTLGLKEAAERTASDETHTFSGLTLFPELAARWETDKKNPDPRVLAHAISHVTKHPELVTAVIWTGLVEKMTLHTLPRRFPAAATWFKTGCPRGTSYDIAGREELLPRSGRVEPPTAALAQLKVISPKGWDVAYYRMSYKAQKRPPLAEVEEELGKRVEYDLRAIEWLAYFSYDRDTALTRRLERRKCELDAGKCALLGAWCVEEGDEACAVAAYERMVEEAPDRVGVANNSRWLMRHYLRHGQRGRARELAEMGADVFSNGGLLTMAAFLEETGAYAEAEEYIARARERYPDEENPHWELIAFYHRMAHVRGVRSYEAKFARLAKKIFPLGVESAHLASFTAPPTDGAQFTSETPALRHNGMRKGDLVVAWEGWRVRNQRQLMAIREFDDEPHVTLVIWRSGKYLEVTARRVGHRFGVDLADYEPTPQAGEP